MKFALGYFYQVRFFTPNMIPVSTAVSDPKWYHQNKGPQFTFLDKIIKLMTYSEWKFNNDYIYIFK